MGKAVIVRNWCVFGIMVILLILAFKNQMPPKQTSPIVPVCHAVTEDSDITDCDYHNGAWWTK